MKERKHGKEECIRQEEIIEKEMTVFKEEERGKIDRRKNKYGK